MHLHRIQKNERNIMKHKTMTVICFFLAVVFLIYGISVRIAGSGGTKFFLVWIGLAIFSFVTGMIVCKGTWDAFPGMVKLIIRVLAACFFLSFLVTEGMIIGKMGECGESNLDYVIVLGAQIYEDKPSVVLKYRLDKAIEYLNDNPDTICIVSGGQGSNEPFAEAYGMQNYLIENKIPEDRIVCEPDSKTTEENIANSMKRIQEGSSVGIITNDFHMFRALQIAKNQGLNNAVGISAKSTMYYLPNNMLREYMAEIKFLIKNAIK